MTSMSYCRFENTLAELRECRDFLENDSEEDLSTSERKYAAKLIRLCEEIAENYDADVFAEIECIEED